MTEEEPNSSNPPPEYNPRRSSWNRDNNTGTFSIGLAVLFVVGLVGKFYVEGFHNIGMIATIAIAAGVMFAFLAPDLFQRSERFDDRDDGRPDLRDIARMSSNSSAERLAPSPGSDEEARRRAAYEER